jgi:hypothetical protein
MADTETKIRLTAVDDATRTLNSIRSSIKDLTGDFGRLGGALSAIGITGALAGLGAMVKSAIDTAAAMQELSQKTGIATKELTALDYAMRREGVSTEAFGKAMQQLSKNMVEAGDASSKAGQLFKVLGVDVNAGPREALLKLSDAFQALPDGATKSAVAMELLGKAGTDLIPALNNGAAGIREMEEEARKLGLTFDQDMGKAAKEFGDKLFALQESSKKLGIVLANETLPGLTRIATAMREAAAESGLLEAAWVGLGGVISEALGLNDDDAQKAKKRAREIREELEELRKLDKGGPGLLERIIGADQTEKIRAKIKQLELELEALAKKAPSADAPAGPDPAVGRRLADDTARVLRGGAGETARATQELSEFAKAFENLRAKLEGAAAGLNADFLKNLGLLNTALLSGNVTLAEHAALFGQLIKLQPAYIEAEKRRLALAESVSKALEDGLRAHRQSIEAIDSQTKAEQLANDTRGMTRSAIQDLIIARLEEEQAILRASGAMELDIELLQQEIDARKKLRDAIRTGEGQENATREQTKALQEQQRVWDDLSSAAGDFFADLVMNGRSAFDNLKRFVKSLLADMIALFAKRWILNLAAGGSVLGSAGNALASTVSGGGSSNILGTALSAGGNWLSGTSMLTGAANWLGGAGSSFATLGTFADFAAGWSGAMQGISVSAMEGATAMTQFGATMQGLAGTLGIFAAVVIAGIAAMKFWKDGWRDMPAFGESAGGFHPMVNDSRVINRLLQAIGFSDRDAFTMSGGPIMSRLWGHRARQNDAMGVRGTVGPFSITGENWQDWSQRGGLFRSDIRGTDVAAFTTDQQAFFANFLRPITSIVEALGERYGVDPRQTLAGYSRDFNLQLNENGEMLSDEKLSELFGNLFGEVLRDQVSAMLEAGGDLRLADYVKDLKGSGEEITAAVQKVLSLLGAIDALGEAIEVLEGGPIVALQKQLDAMNKRVEKANEALDKAFTSGNPEEVLAAEQELAAAIMDRYNAEIKMVRDLQAAIRQTEEAAYQFALNIAARINATGGNRDIGAIAMNRATALRAGIGGNAPTSFQLQDLQGYVGAIDTWYNARRDAIMRDAQAQAAAANAVYQAQASAAQARVSALEKELDLARSFQDLVDRTTEMLREMSLSSMNPLPITGRLALAGDEVTAARTAFQTASGQDRAAAANKLLDALVRQRDLGMEAFARPSQEWQDLYNSIVREIAGIQEEAKPAAERAIELQAQIVEAQLQANRYAAMTADASAIAAGAMQALDEEARSYYEFAETEAVRLFGIQRQEQQALLATITGGMEPNFFIAQRSAEIVAELRGMRQDLRTWASTRPPPASGSNTQAGERGASDERFVVDTVVKNARVLKRAFEVA